MYKRQAEDCEFTGENVEKLPLAVMPIALFPEHEKKKKPWKPREIVDRDAQQILPETNSSLVLSRWYLLSLADKLSAHHAVCCPMVRRVPELQKCPKELMAHGVIRDGYWSNTRVK